MQVAQDSMGVQSICPGSSGEEGIGGFKEKTLELTLKSGVGAWQKDEYERIFQIGRNASMKMQSYGPAWSVWGTVMCNWHVGVTKQRQVRGASHQGRSLRPRCNS